MCFKKGYVAEPQGQLWKDSGEAEEARQSNPWI